MSGEEVMTNEPQVLIFKLNGTSETVEPDEATRPPYNRLGEIVTLMNNKADAICDKIEREVKKLLPPTVTVQANVQFEEGSLILSGTVAVLSWGGSVVFQTIKGEIEEQLAGLVKIAVQRVMNRQMTTHDLFRSLRPMSMTVTPQPFLSSPRTAEQLAAKPTALETEQCAHTENASADARPTAVNLLIVATLLIFLIQIAMLLDRFFILQLRT